jgi:hypothetical protein
MGSIGWNAVILGQGRKGRTFACVHRPRIGGVSGGAWTGRASVPILAPLMAV